MSLPTFALPGQPLGSLPKQTPGSGTHASGPTIHASLAGPVHSTKTRKTQTSLSVRRPPHGSTLSASSFSSLLPAVDNTVLARVTRLQQRQAVVEILVVYPSGTPSSSSPSSPARLDRDPTGTTATATETGFPSPPGFQGIIRAQDVRATEKDRVKIAESFAVGDIVRGVVVSLGDQSAYYISTARNELGVVVAVSRMGRQMVPVSWKEFEEVGTGRREARKVAKPF